VAAIAALAGRGAAVNGRDEGPNHWTPLQHAVHKNQPGAVRALLAAGADPDAGDQGGTTPLIMAAGYGQLESVELLLAAGADARRENHDNLDALWAAAGYGALADVSDGPPLGSCFPEVAAALLARAPEMRLRWGLEARITYWLARKDCKQLIDRLRVR
jgi:ankyrin repeat protein